MNDGQITNLQLKSKLLIDTLFRIGLFVFLLYLCAMVFSPFLLLMLWALILAVALYPLHQKLANKLGGKQGRASFLIVLVGVLILVIPCALLAVSFIGDSQNAQSAISTGSIAIPPPDATVAEWPVIGEKLHAAWSLASSNLPQFLETYHDKLESISAGVLSAASGLAGSVLLFLASLIVSGIMMAYGQGGNSAMQRVFCRFAGKKQGSELHGLSTATVRSVAAGVIGVAFFQGLLFGIGFLLADIPFPTLLALAVFLTAIVQLPAIIFGIPAIAFLWLGGDGGVVGNILLSVYFLVAGFSDDLLKPFLLGRGVDAPLAVILIGALGGMITSGFIGLFVGAVLLAVAYKLFMNWVDEDDPLDNVAES